MIDLCRAWAARTGHGFLRSRKQLVWVIFFMCGILLLYVHLSPPMQLSEDPPESQHRALHSYRNSPEPTEEKPGTPRRVKFLGPKSNLLEAEGPPGGDLPPLKMLPPVLEPLQELPRKAEEVKSSEVPQPVFDGAANNFDNSWSGGAYKYNTFGMPVYNHGGRPNYIPKHRVVHFDLKGAPPKVSAFKTVIPWIAKYGATAILLEYEDMFPWHGELTPLLAKNHYSRSDIKEILSLCKQYKLEIIPLVQTFGHLEYALKHEVFASLREVPEHPTSICPSRNESVRLVHSMIDQIMELHKGVSYLHIGCDEVLQMGECDKCRLKSRETVFLEHVASIAKYVRDRHHAKSLIWHDMLSHVSDTGMKEYNFGALVEPMVWVYAEDVYRFAGQGTWDKLASVFSTVWAASAFKGAFGEQTTVPNVRRHLDNNLNWLDVMAAESSKFKNGFQGLVITGWQRFDHFAVVCELIPAAIPSLAVNLIATSHGFFNSTVETDIYESLNCMQAAKYETEIDLDSDPFLWDKFSWCFFPGSLVFKVTSRLDAARKEFDAYYNRVTLKRGWITDYNRRHNFSLPTRIDEDMEELPSRIHTLTLLLKTAKDALDEWFDSWTVGEWIETYIWPMLNKLEQLQKESEAMRSFRTWPSRPLPMLKALSKYGITEPPSKDSSHHKNNL